MGKLMNAGQICLAPDYLLVAADQEEEVIESVSKGAASLYPTLLANDDYTSVINTRNFDRLQGYLADARIDRKSVVSGKSVSVRVDLGGRRIIKKKKTNNNDNN